MSGTLMDMTAWRDARSLVTLRNEVRAVAPGTTFWTIGDDAHKLSWSDHNPNQCCAVVCAADILSNAGLNLDWLVQKLIASNHPALKYIIYRNQIWFPQVGWQSYGGMYHSHVHVSVGDGPDGRSTGPYDNTSPWGIANSTQPSGGNMPDTIASRVARGAQDWLEKGDQGDAVWELQVRIGHPPSGIFDAATDSALRKWQKAHGLVDDGVVGPMTWGKLADLTTYQTSPPNPDPGSPPPATIPDDTAQEIINKLTNIENTLNRVFK